MKPKAATKRAAIMPEPYSFPTTIAVAAAFLVALAETEVLGAVPDAAGAEVEVGGAEEEEVVGAVKLAISRVPHWSLIFVVQLSWPAWLFWLLVMQ
jgi:hypothetical protein